MPGDPHSGSKLGHVADRKISKPGQNPGKVIAYPDFQATAAFYEREVRDLLKESLAQLWGYTKTGFVAFRKAA